MEIQAKRLDPALAALKSLLGDRLSTAHSVREHHGRDITHHTASPPDAVAFAETTEEVSQIIKICAEHNVPVIPFGTGTSLEGHIMAPYGGISIDLGAMNQVLRINPQDMDCTVQACVTRKQLNEYIRDTGLFFPIDPGADASIGGMAATRASGTNAVRYGTMRENVLGLTIVQADGRIIKTGGRAKKSSAGYDLTRLFVGSEGTLGVITEITLKLYPVPEAISAAVCNFESLEGAVDTVISTIQCGVPIARIELLNDVQLKAINNYSKTDFPEKPTLFLEFHGSPAGVQEQIETVQELARDNGGGGFQWAEKAEDRTRLWSARHNAAYAAQGLRPGANMLSTDVCVPISRLADCILETTADLEKNGLETPIVGHVGDGNFHLVLFYDENNREEIALIEGVNERMVHRAIAMGGTCTGEHGIGQGKLDFLIAEHGEAVATMRQVKQALDPKNIMNPGKILRV